MSISDLQSSIVLSMASRDIDIDNWYYKTNNQNSDTGSSPISFDDPEIEYFEAIESNPKLDAS